MKRFAMILVATVLAATTSLTRATEVAGVKVDETARAGTADLVLNGAGLRK